MQPIHSIEYELTTELANDVQRTLVRWEFRRSWRRDAPVFLGALLIAAAIAWLTLQSWILPTVGGGLMCLLSLFVIAALFRLWSISRGAVAATLLPLHTSDRQVRIEFGEERVRLEMEYFRGEGAWTELDEVVVFAGFWVLYLSNGGQILIPGPLVSPELDSFIRAKAQQVLAPIRQP
jgi:hypothetical protein